MESTLDPKEITEYSSYADYSIVKFQIYKAYYELIGIFTKKYYPQLQLGKTNPKLKILIQSYLLELSFYLMDYKSVKESSEIIYFKEKGYRIDSALELIKKMAKGSTVLSHEGLLTCISAVTTAMHELGLRRIEHEKPDLQEVYDKSY